MPKVRKIPTRSNGQAPKPSSKHAPPHSLFGAAVRELTSKYGLRSQTVCKRCGVDPSSLSRIMSGHVLAVTPVAALLKNLPTNEEERAELQRCLLLDLVAPYGQVSPLLKLTTMSAEEAVAAWQHRLGNDPVLQQSLDDLLNSHQQGMMARDILISMSKVFKRWQPYPIPEPNALAVAED